MKDVRDKKLWIFNAGKNYQGNPKWLMEYIRMYRKDISVVWMCYDSALKNYLQGMGRRAALYDSGEGREIMEQAGVYVVEMCKEHFQPELEGIVILNLWHGVGCKTVERKVTKGFLSERIAKKYIRYHEVFRNQQLFLVTSDAMKAHFMEQCGLKEEQLICEGYPKNQSLREMKTYNPAKAFPKLKKALQQGENRKQLVLYAPTYRDVQGEDFLETALPDRERLISVLKKQNMILIIKLHPLVENTPSFLKIKKQYEQTEELCFWDNRYDIYEIFDEIETGIVDYSSIFYDLLAKGVKKFIRYFFDIHHPERFRDYAFDVQEMTCGVTAYDFEGLLLSLQDIQEIQDGEFERLHRFFWEYETENPCESIIQKTLLFEPLQEKDPVLYSFDVFDTLITRKCRTSQAVFDRIRRKIYEENLGLDAYLYDHFVKLRIWCEKGAREYLKKSVLLRGDERLEVTLRDIYGIMQRTYGLTEQQKERLIQLECETEMESVLPVKENIEKVKGLMEKGETVIFISDMYLPKNVIAEMLKTAEPSLAEIPLFVSSECGYQKTTKRLFLEVYYSLNYHFSKWVHTGDNEFADVRQPEKLGIETQLYRPAEMSAYDKYAARYNSDYGFQCMVKKFVEFNERRESAEQEFAYKYVGLYLVPYVVWAVQDAVSKGYECIYFIARDGFYLKKAADEVIRYLKLRIKTKYIYGSRKAWRLSSFIEDVDGDFFEEYGNFGNVVDFPSLLHTMYLSEEQFLNFFPEYGYLKKKRRISHQIVSKIAKAAKGSFAYRNYLLELGKKERELVLDYLRQEICGTEKYVFLEYWGRGYTQECLARLLHAAFGEDALCSMYYVRSIYDSFGNAIRYQYTKNIGSLVFIESVFSNLAYQSLEKYERKDGRVVPVLLPCKNNPLLHEQIQKELVNFTRDYCALGLYKEKTAGHLLFNFSLYYFYTHKTKDPLLLEVFGELSDGVSTWEEPTDYAPAITFRTILDWMHGKSFYTKSYEMSFQKSNWIYRTGFKMYAFYCEKIRGRLTKKYD